ncbi:DHA2 family efflux MFS transporter permease subunit [Gordonia amicalis]|uniref:DHA2 family efflux MFS transporter permease subunit n=1 Tax=Gordonia amicalis TaxID=89053 RepID=UPI0002A6294A|nr:DHA2 family efflux MFS transporter permease subunit [Gordonia amicalis]NKX78675.1 DHA2 family efflux MFS transporter permease subunit [Gordonia amicalis]GAC55557.1 putative drug resistance transporter [Gordonia amicalis NBRC 100051 = JCM 11271]
MTATPAQIGSPAASSPLARPGLTLLILSGAAFMASLDVFIVNVAFDDISSDFDGSTLSQMSWILNTYAILYAALLVPAGRIVDRYGRKGGFLFGLALFTVASAACAAAQGVWWLVAFRALQAVGAAILTPASLGLVVSTLPPERRARGVKIWAATGALAAAFGPAVGGVLVEASWRWVFLVNIPVGIAALVAGAIILVRSRNDAVTEFPDALGAALLVVSVGALTLGLVQGSDWGWSDPRIIGAWIVALVAFVGFVLSSRRHAEPVIDPALLRIRTFSSANIAMLLFSIPFAGALLANILWLQQVWGFSAIATGLAVSTGPLMVPIFAAVADRLSSRVPVGVIVAAGCVLFAVGIAMVALSVDATPDFATEMLPGWLIGGVGVGFALPSILSSATADLPAHQAATGSAVVNMSRQVGMSLGVSLFVAIVGTAVIYDDVRDAFVSAWWALAAIGVVGGVVALGMTPRAGR